MIPTRPVPSAGCWVDGCDGWHWKGRGHSPALAFLTNSPCPMLSNFRIFIQIPSYSSGLCFLLGLGPNNRQGPGSFSLIKFEGECKYELIWKAGETRFFTFQNADQWKTKVSCCSSSRRCSDVSASVLLFPSRVLCVSFGEN